MTPLALIIRLGVVQHELKIHREHQLEKVAELIEKTAKDAIGTYTFGWPALAPETVAQKASGDTPLLETGALRESIEHTVSHSGLESHADVGSNSDIAVYQTYGTSRGIPPRPFMEPAARVVEEKLDEMFHEVFKASFK